MRKIPQLFCPAIVLAIIGLGGCMPSNKEANVSSDDCLARMSEETASHIREMKIPLKGADAELYSSKEEQVYLLNSQEPVKLSAKESFSNTVAVINHREANGKSTFYRIDQEIGPEKITFVLRKNAEILKSVPVNVILPRQTLPGPGVGNCESDCDTINASYDADRAATQADANRTCSKVSICLPICQCFGGKQFFQLSWIEFKPTNWRCWRVIATEYYAFSYWALKDPSPLLNQALDMAITKETRLYAY